MREDLHATNGSPMNGTAPHGLPTPANDVPSSGFTAVNGDSQRPPGPRPDESVRPAPVTMANGERGSQSGAEHGPPSGPYHPHNWRPGERHYHDSQRQHYETALSNKRKRNEPSGGPREEGQDVQHHVGNESPKRRMAVLNSGGISSPARPDQSHSKPSDGQGLPPATTGTYVREPTPDYRKDRAEPPPPPPPEAEAVLAASLQQSLNAQQRVERQAEPAAAESSDGARPTEEPYGNQRSPNYSSGDGQNLDLDPKKRKRNFSNRTKTGCHTCRARKKKCDEGKPTCENCRRGAFDCGGYGPKPPGGIKATAARPDPPLQAKGPYPPQHPPGGHYYEPPPFHTNPYHHPPPSWDHVARPELYPPPQPRYGPPPPGPSSHNPPPPPTREPCPPRPWGNSEPTPSYLSERLPPVDFSGVHPGHYPPPERPTPIDSFGPPHSQSRRAPPPLLPPAPPTAPATVISSRSGSSHSGGHGGAAPLSLQLNGAPSERTKMLSGQPYQHYIDHELLRDRESCKRAVESYNNANSPNSTMSTPEKERHFKYIRDPKSRTFGGTMMHGWTGPSGTCGHRTIVESPFDCELGYNIHLGSDVVIGANCFMQDACPVVIGDRTIVGPSVKFYCITASVDANLRRGSRGNFMAGPIRVGEDCFIGADVMIMPFRTIGKGAVVGAGSVVTRDVKPYTVVAGNPAKPVRKRKIESGPNVDRHDDAIQEENEKMMQWMSKDFPAFVRDKQRSGGSHSS
ncbi:hypothetical protein DOTSEDRAFT_71999 [Lecanosticta acicola]|uniref:Zn(2)-C6 fungal-type domain-containing protein n=1 Tax=Lecanosticta acicola TaxID=111012 RepID=A0AAI9EAL9_9PEZI|nr:hypothetical protein DOTSEDRAFT_71999 [Lecanosticta acicola]